MADATGRGSAWSVVALRGALMLVFGLYAVVFPGAAVTVLMLIGGALLLIDGILGLWSHTFGNARTGNFWFDVVRNALSILTGAIILVSPMLATLFTVTFLIYLVAIQALIVGGMEIWFVVRAREVLRDVWPVLLSGILYVLFAIMLFFAPFESALALVIVGGVFMIVFAIGLFGLAWRLRKAGI